MIVYVAKFSLKDGAKAQLLQALTPLIEATRREAGNISYDYYISLENENTMMSFERWKTQEDVAAHLQSQHFLKFVEQTRELYAAAPEMNAYPVADTDQSL